MLVFVIVPLDRIGEEGGNILVVTGKTLLAAVTPLLLFEMTTTLNRVFASRPVKVAEVAVVDEGVAADPFKL
jgi:hypothetical protein